MKINLVILFIYLSSIFFVLPAYSEDFPVVIEAEQRVVIAAEREGVLSSLNVDAGASVNRGNTLAVVFHDDLIFQKQLKEVTRKYLRFQFENLKQLNQKGLAADEELAKSEMELAVNGKEISIIETNIDRSIIKAPFSGVIIDRKIQPYEWVKPGQPVVEMYNSDQLRIVADIPASRAVQMRVGQTHSIFFQALNREVLANLKVLVPQVDVRSNTIKIYWSVPRESTRQIDLLPGMKGTLKLGNE